VCNSLRLAHDGNVVLCASDRTEIPTGGQADGSCHRFIMNSGNHPQKSPPPPPRRSHSILPRIDYESLPPAPPPPTEQIKTPHESPPAVPQRVHSIILTRPKSSTSPSLPSYNPIPPPEVLPINSPKQQDDAGHQFLLVTIGEHQIAGNGANRHGLYLVITVTNVKEFGPKFQQGQLVVPRRYGQFSTLCTKLDPDAALFGIFPRRRLFSSF